MRDECSIYINIHTQTHDTDMTHTHTHDMKSDTEQRNKIGVAVQSWL